MLQPENFGVSSEPLKPENIIINIRINQLEIRPYMTLAEALPVVMKRVIVIPFGKGYAILKRIYNRP